MTSVQRLPARLGVLIPSTDTTAEQELPAFLGDAASFHVARMRLSEVTPAGLASMDASALEAADLLADVSPDLVLFACTSGTFIKGPEHERWFAAQLAVRVTAPVITTAWSLAQVLPRHGRRIRLRTPYTQDLTRLEADYLRTFGLEVTSSACLGLTDDTAIADVTSHRLHELAAGDDLADMLLLSCTNLPSRSQLERVSKSTGMPVISSNSASATVVGEVLTGRLAPLARPPGRD
ncbi:hypothetical protein [Brevibacterium sp.]|uniref:maleate cis-trans isomerase family protein n=1 Tax=Brevibacterium sp. TaxID=1701 RepID=UPI002811AC86|nr:hypothetical protein [Brevibacterium sp.]